MGFFFSLKRRGMVVLEILLDVGKMMIVMGVSSIGRQTGKLVLFAITITSVKWSTMFGLRRMTRKPNSLPDSGR